VERQGQVRLQACRERDQPLGRIGDRRLADRPRHRVDLLDHAPEQDPRRGAAADIAERQRGRGGGAGQGAQERELVPHGELDVTGHLRVDGGAGADLGERGGALARGPVQLAKDDAAGTGGVADAARRRWSRRSAEAADDLEPAHRPRDALGVIDAVLQRDDRDSRSGKRREVLCRRLLGVLGLHAEQHGVAGTDLGGLAGRVHQGVGIPGDAVQVNPGRGWPPGGCRGPRRARRPPPRPAGRQPAADLPAPTTAILMTLTRSLEPGRRGRGPGPARGPRSRPRTPPAGTARCAR
jgi:hypothetical protein